MNSYGAYSSGSTGSSSSWSYGGTGASIWQTGSLSSMHTSPAAVTVTRSSRVTSSSAPSIPLSSSSSLIPDDIHWSNWPNTIATVTPVDAKSRPYRPDFDLPAPPPSLSIHPSESTSNTLCMSNLEPWMDHEYASQVVRLMGWDRNVNSPNPANPANAMQNAPVTIKIPPPSADSIPQHNNPGYCLITFPTAAHAASVLASLHSLSHKDTSATPLLMPNSSKPFNLQWASSAQLSQVQPLPLPFPGSAPNPLVNSITLASNNTALSSSSSQKEYSIFVGDLAPETSNSDLVAVFRNPVLGLRNDREPKFIRPFYSCKSAKIMLDPVTGVSRGYGFVRFTDEADQQRALIEMHGLYCLSRPMRVSPATAKFKPEGSANGILQQQPDKAFSESTENTNIKPPLVRSVSSPVAAQTTQTSALNHISTFAAKANSSGSNTPDVKTPNPEQPVQTIQVTPQILAQIKELAASDGPPRPPVKEWNLAHIQQMATLGNFGNSSSSSYPSPAYNGSSLLDEAWNHQAQARAILGNLIGPNGEQLTSTDPYNTTVFVGGLSPLISEETLRTFFAPFGDIHYVKVPLGKHCGFVQFVRKADAERAIERMQGFPIGGSRIRLSWGRSQYKAAQAAAQAAQQAHAEHATRIAAALSNGQGQPMLQLTQEQAIQLLYSLGYNPQNVVGNDPQSVQFQFPAQNMPIISSGVPKQSVYGGTEPSQTTTMGPSTSALPIPLTCQYPYSQSFNDALSRSSGHYSEEIDSSGDSSHSGSTSTKAASSRLANLTNLNISSLNNGVYPSHSAEGNGHSSLAFQASDILRNDSSPFAIPGVRIGQEQQHHLSEPSPVIHRTPHGMQASKFLMRDDPASKGIDYLTTSLSDFHMSHEMFSPRESATSDRRNGSAATENGIDMAMNGNGDAFRDRRPLSNSISASLSGLINGNGSAKLSSESQHI